ncbi:unnamed protein product, partial [Scytosiphon promiscuus]
YPEPVGATGDDLDEEEKGAGATAHRGTARSGRGMVTTVAAAAAAAAEEELQEGGVDGAVHAGQEPRETPTQLPPSGRKSLSPWGSYQLEVHGAGRDSSRRRPKVPTLGPASYSLPVTPQGRHAHAGVADDLACEAAEGWSVPPMPYEDFPTGGDRIRQSQSFEQQGTDFGGTTGTTPATREAFLGGGVGRSDGRSNRSMRLKVAPSLVVVQPTVGRAGGEEVQRGDDDGAEEEGLEAREEGFASGGGRREAAPSA